MRQRIIHGAEIDTATPSEIAKLLFDAKSNIDEIAIQARDGSGSDRKLDDYPVPGRTRQILAGRLRGTDNLYCQVAVPTLTLTENPARRTALIVNYGASDVILYYCDIDTARASTATIAATYIAAGGSWSTKLPDVYIGGLVAIAQAGSTQLTVMEA
jgi:hypothetical protein